MKELFAAKNEISSFTVYGKGLFILWTEKDNSVHRLYLPTMTESLLFTADFVPMVTALQLNCGGFSGVSSTDFRVTNMDSQQEIYAFSCLTNELYELEGVSYLSDDELRADYISNRDAKLSNEAKSEPTPFPEPIIVDFSGVEKLAPFTHSEVAPDNAEMTREEFFSAERWLEANNGLSYSDKAVPSVLAGHISASDKVFKTDRGFVSAYDGYCVVLINTDGRIETFYRTEEEIGELYATADGKLVVWKESDNSLHLFYLPTMSYTRLFTHDRDFTFSPIYDGEKVSATDYRITDGSDETISVYSVLTSKFYKISPAAYYDSELREDYLSERDKYI